MNEPIRLLGLTLDELGLLFVGIMGFILIQSILFRMGFLLGIVILVMILKKYKKLTVGFCLRSYTHWTLGLRGNLPKEWPASWERIWRS